MSESIAVNDVLAVVVEGTCEGRPWAFIRHYIVQAVTLSVTLTDAIRDQFVNTILDNMKDELTDQWQAECLSIHRVAPEPRNVVFYPFGAPIVGAIATDGTPNDNALLLKFTTADTGPRNRGRMFVPGLPEASTNGGLLLATKQAAWDSIAGDFTTNAGTLPDLAAPVIFSRTAYGTDPPGHPVDVQDYTSVIVSAAVIGNLASQRRRRRRRNVFG